MPILLPIADLIVGEDSPAEFLFDPFLPKRSCVLLAGQEGAGKSFLAYTLAMGLATGTSVLGWTTVPSSVLYFDQANGWPDCVQYLRWAWHGLGTPPLDLIRQNLHMAHFQLGARNWVDRAGTLVVRTQPALLVFDTATPCCGLEDENDNAEASRSVNKIRALCGLSGASALILKHAKIQHDGHAGYSIRGAKTWGGAVDSVVFHVRSAGHPRTDGLANTKLEPTKTRAFGLRLPVKITPVWTQNQRGLSLHLG